MPPVYTHIDVSQSSLLLLAEDLVVDLSVVPRLRHM